MKFDDDEICHFFMVHGGEIGFKTDQLKKKNIVFLSFFLYAFKDALVSSQSK